EHPQLPKLRVAACAALDVSTIVTAVTTAVTANPRAARRRCAVCRRRKSLFEALRRLSALIQILLNSTGEHHAHFISRTTSCCYPAWAKPNSQDGRAGSGQAAYSASSSSGEMLLSWSGPYGQSPRSMVGCINASTATWRLGGSPTG